MLTPDMARALVKSLQSVIGMKITAQWDIGGFIRIASAMKEVRNVGALKAGGQAQYAHYAYGCDGSLSGGSNFSTADDIAVRQLVIDGKHAEAQQLSDSWMPVYNAIYGTQVGLPVVYFHFRYKLTAWLSGVIEAAVDALAASATAARGHLGTAQRDHCRGQACGTRGDRAARGLRCLAPYVSARSPNASAAVTARRRRSTPFRSTLRRANSSASSVRAAAANRRC